MTLQNLPGGLALLGPHLLLTPSAAVGTLPLDAANEAGIFIGRIRTADGGSHTLDTTGSSSIGWRSNTVTFANGATSMSVGIAPVDLANGPPGRAANTAGVIDFDVKAVFAGGGGGITTAAWQTSVPTTGSKTIANGDLVAVAFQMTARGGADLVQVSYMTGTVRMHRPAVSFYTGSFTPITGVPDCLITFSDGTLGWIESGEIFSTRAVRTWNSGSATKEYGQLFQMPFPMKVYGVYGYGSLDNDLDLVLYSDPLGTPVAEKTATVDVSVLATTGVVFEEIFASPYSVAANQPIGAVFKPGASNISVYYKTLQSATHRVGDVYGASGYGISRASGAFSNANSSLDHYYIGLLVSALGDDVSTGRSVQINNDSVVGS